MELTDRAMEWELLNAKLAQRTRGTPAFSTVARPQRPVISFGGGVPDPKSLPLDDLKEAAQAVLDEQGKEALQYGGPYGYEGLRELLAEQVRQIDKVNLSADGVTIVSGSSQGLENICFAFLDPGDVVITEETSFPGSLWTFRSHQAEPIGISLDREGLRTDILDEALKGLAQQGRHPKLIYTIPNFHNPTGVTQSLARRRELLELAHRYGVIVVEDDAYGDLRYDGERIPSLFSLSGGNGVLKMGTFSKTIAPGLRLGWVTGHEKVVASLTRMRLDMGTSPFVSRVVAEYMRQGKLAHHIAEVVSIYRKKRDCALANLGEKGASWVWAKPQGGFFLWLELPQGLDSRSVLERAHELGVGFIPGPPFFVSGDGGHYLRLAFSFVSLEEIATGIQALLQAIDITMNQHHKTTAAGKGQ